MTKYGRRFEDMRTVGIVTLGCRVNQYESVALAELLQKKGFAVQKGEGDCDVYLVNTCAVTAESQRQCRQAVRRCAAKAPTAVIGCASQNAKEEFLSIDGVFYAGGCRDKSAAADAVMQAVNAVEAGKTDRVESMEGAPYEDMALCGESDLFSSCRSYLKIQDGCSGHCTYCVIPSLRGRSRSRDPDDVYEEAVRMVGKGYRELVLTGIETSAYSACPLEELIFRLGSLEKRGLARVRLGSLSSGTLRRPFLEKVSQVSNFMPHIHLSLQSGSDSVLERMKRPDRRGQMEERVALLREYLPGVRISADFITGFPGETEEDYLLTEKLVKEMRLFHVHAFPYSERRGTPAAEMEGSVPVRLRKERCARLNRVSDGLREEILRERIGQTVTVLTEKLVCGIAVGHTESFEECRFSGKGAAVGELIAVRVTGQDGKGLLGERE